MLLDTEYAELLRVFVQLVESQSRKEIQPGNEWLNDAQILSTKLFRHLVSMQCLAAGATVEAEELPTVTHVDYASIQVIARAALETYLVFFFVYGDPDRKLSAFRHMLWHYSGLVDRQKYTIKSREGREKLKVERGELAEIGVEIQSSPYFDSYTDNQKRQLLKGKWRTGKSWRDLGINARFHAGYFDNIYNYLCGYSHSSYASVLQVGQAQSIAEQRMLTKPILGIGVVLMSHFAFSYPTVFPDASLVISANPVAQGIAEKWRFGPEDMEEYYGA